MGGLSDGLALLISLGIVALSAFFVAVEFALVAARRNRLEEQAGDSVAARAALASARDLSLLLAGSQLGITLCTLALGAVGKPAVHHLMTPAMEAWGLAEVTADLVAFVLSLLVVTFIHLVVGEMAPKSWAIAHPERSAILLAIPMRAFMWLTRPALVALNGLANWTLRRIGVEPVDEVSAGRTPDDLRHLLDHSAEAGALDRQRHDQLAGVLDLYRKPLADLARRAGEPAAVAPESGIDQIKATARTSGHLRLLVRDATGDPVGVVHARDALTAPADATAADLMRPVATLPADTTIHRALVRMRDTRTHFTLVDHGNGPTELITMQDVLDQLLAPVSPAPAAPSPAGPTAAR